MALVKGFLHPAQSLELLMFLKKCNRDSLLPQLLPKAFLRMFYRDCCCGQLLITELFLGPACSCRLVWLVGLLFYNNPWHLLLKLCPWYLWLSCCCFSVLCTKFNLLRALSEIPVQEVCSMPSLGRAVFPSERRQRRTNFQRLSQPSSNQAVCYTR